jgi:hypothetical protein
MNDRARRIAAPALAILAVLLLLAALVAGYGVRALLNADQFADRAAAALDEESVADEIGRRAADELIAADPDLISVRPVLEEVVSGAVGSGAFRDIFRAAVADVHRAVFDQDQDTVAFTLADIGTVARGALQAVNPKLAKEIPPNTGAAVMQSDPPQFVVEATKLRALPWILLAAAVLLIGGAIWLAPDNRRTVIVSGIAITIAGVLAATGLDAVRALVLSDIERGSSARDAAMAIWDAFFGDLHRALILFGVAGAVITAAGSSLLRPVDISVPLKLAWSIVTTVPENRRWRAVRGMLLLAAGILVVIEHEFVIDLVAILVGLFLAYAGAAELMRLTIADPEHPPARDRAHRRPLAVAGLSAVLILGAGTLFISVGDGMSEEPAEIETVGCNGGDELCDRPLDRVAFPSTHNAMSAATNPGWLFAQQEKGFPDQLQDGIRGLLIDAHYGQPTESGAVKTDLSDLDSKERAAYEEELGPEALDAALRIRDRIIGSPTTGPRQVYLCHRFCELGAIPIDTAFGAFRDFVAAYPNEVLVVDIEDYVDPDDIAAAAERTGLIDSVYTGALGDPWPTLREMIESGGRVVMLAEHDAGSIPWYHQAYDELLQETPYSFKKPVELTDPQRLAASCEPNRGPADAPLFLINHWIDTSPAPKPSNAAKVNAHDALLARVHECERDRDLLANLIAVDFYREGDLFGVVKELNGER